MICAARQATIAVGVPGFSITGTPARTAPASFSIIPQTGKLKALTCTATPGRVTHTCWPEKRAVRPSCTCSPSTRYGVSGRPFAKLA